MRIRLLFLFLCGLHTFAQETKFDLKGTVWQCSISKDCVNQYSFLTADTFEFYSCEREETYYGEYYFENDFLMIYEKGSYEESEDYYKQKLYKVSLKAGCLVHVQLSYKEGEQWIASNFVLDDKYEYCKAKSKISSLD
ncbi:hypothetical protein [Myroides odoratus]|uniref:hypothetical protein n=1 Tax=Myroides odoratus TaxID=256 RepID=UPI00333FAF44